MAFEFRTFALPFLVSAVICLLVALLILQRQNVKGSLALALFMLQLAIWGGASFVRWSLVDPHAQIFWLQLSHAVFVAAPVTFLVFVSQLTDTDRWITQSRLIFLASEPVATSLVIWTNGSHSLFYRSMPIITSNGFPEMSWVGGPWYWFTVACSYAFILAAAVILLRALLHGGPYVRVQLVTVIIGCLLPWGLNFYTLVFPAASRQLELTPLAATGSGLLFAYALFRQRLVDIIPVARGLLFEKLRDGVLVLDTHDRVMDANLSAQRILHVDDKAFGRPVWELFPQWREFEPAPDVAASERHFELQGRLDSSHFYDVSVTSLLDGRGRPNGRLISLRDITDRKHAETELHKMNARLQKQVHKVSALHDALKEQAIRDSLTGLYNRRYLDETLQREFSRARRASYPISVLMMDIDGFKKVNDTHGHKAGDQVLRSLGEIIRQHVRFGDIPCRFGGEEFVIILPETSIQIAAQRAEQIRLRFHEVGFFKGNRPLVPTLSVGIAAFPAHARTAEAVLHAADRAMYSAKACGGDNVMSYRPVPKRKSAALRKKAER